MRLFERRDRIDWWLTRPPWFQKLPLALMMLLALVAGLGIGAVIWAGHGPAIGQVVQIVPGVPPGEVQVQQTPTASGVVPLPMEEMTVIEPVQTAAPKLTEADLRAYEKSIYHEVNNRRVEAGVPALIWDDRVADVARKHSKDMAARGYFSHVSPEGVNPWQRLQMAGLPAGSENLRGGYGNAQKDVDDWLASEGHRKNILDAGVRRTGVGIANGPDWPILTQNFTP